jgi:hypothetical protein
VTDTGGDNNYHSQSLSPHSSQNDLEGDNDNNTGDTEQSCGVTALIQDNAGLVRKFQEVDHKPWSTAYKQYHQALLAVELVRHTKMVGDYSLH